MMESTTEDSENDHYSDFGSYDDNAIFTEKEKDQIENHNQEILIQNPSAYCILNQTQAEKYIEGVINDIVDASGIRESTAFYLLKKFGWDQQKVKDHLTEDLDILLKAEDNFQEFTCSICFVIEPINSAYSFGCSHYFCKNCFQEYIKVAVNEGQPLKTCPTEGCKEILTPKLCLYTFENDQDIINKYKSYLLENIVTNSSNLLWCPGTGCINVIQLLKIKKSDKVLMNIRCTCGYSFCLTCRDIAHRPLSCDLFAKWKTKVVIDEKEDFLNFDWIMKNSKSCPRCLVNIEKNQGCMHMTCRNCSHEFCWICLEKWKDHSTGKCNSFKPSKVLFVNEEKEIESFYKERFGKHWSSLKYALYKKRIILENFKTINDHAHCKEDDSFLREALDSIIDTRRAISMTYAAGNLGLNTDLHELQQSLLWASLDHLDKFTDPLQSEENMKDLFTNPDQAGIWTGSLGNYKSQLKVKIEGVVIACNKLLKSMEEEFEIIKDGEIKKYYVDEDWYCEFCTFKNSRMSGECQECKSMKTVFGDRSNF